MLGSNFRRFLRLASKERLLLCRCFLAITAVDLGLRLHGFRDYVAGIERRPGRSEADLSVSDLRRAQTYVRWIEAAAPHYPAPARCLHRSLALHLMLRRENLPSRLRIGVRKVGNELNAHAWIELGGYIINDDSEFTSRFATLGHPNDPHPGDVLV